MLVCPNSMMNPQGDPFSPLNIDGLFRWYDASDLDTITESSGDVSQWDDKSPNADYMTGTSLKPKTGTRSQNGLNAIEFLRTDQLDWNEFFTGAITSHTIFIASKADAASCWMARTPTYGTNFFITGHSSLGSAIRMNGSGVGVANTDGNTTDWILSASVIAPGSGEMYVNGNNDNSTYTAGTHDFAVQNMGNYSSTANDADGAIGEMIIYNRALPDAEREEVEAYLMAKWNL